MWVPKRLIICNFRSIKYQELDFLNGDTELIQGVNETDEGFESNGSGKSSIREALCLALGLPIFAATLSDVINDQSDEAYVFFYAQNTVNKNRLTIRRTISHKKSSVLEIKINEIDQKDKFSSVPEGDKLIFDILGIPREDVLSHFIISKEKFTSFFYSSDKDKKDLINRFSKANLIDNVFPILEKEIKVKEEVVNVLNSEIIKLSGKLEILNEDFIEAKNFNPEDEKNSQINKLNEELGNNIKTKEDAQKDLKTIEGNIDKKITELTPYYVSFDQYEKELKELKESLKGKEDRLQEKSSKLNEFKGFLTEVNLSLKGVIKCPECFHEFTLEGEVDIEEAKSQIPIVEGVIKDLEDDIKSLNSEIELLEDKFEKKQSQYDICEENIQSILEESDELEENKKLKLKVIDLQTNYIESLEEKITKAKSLVVESKQDLIQQKIKEAEDKTKELEGELKEVNIKLSELSIWVVRFNKFKSHLANQSLGNIQGLTNIYLEEMKTNLGVRIEGFKQNKDGSVREKITPIVLRNGMIEGSGSYKKYSGGERARIDITITLAMRYLINQASETGGLDLFWIDEITEGVDSLGIENLAKSINNLRITSLITSHVKHESNYPNILKAIKRKGETILERN